MAAMMAAATEGGKLLTRVTELLAKKDVAMGDLLQLMEPVTGQEEKVDACSDGIEAMTGMRSDLSELVMAGPRNEVAGRTMIDMDDLLLDLVDAGPLASADIAMPIVIDTDTFFDHRSVLTDYAVP